jgi:hypothetical protein
MPVTGTLGALTYTKTILGGNDWVMHFSSTDFANLPVNFVSFDSLQGEMYIAGGLNLASAGGWPTDVYSNTFVMSVYTDGVPRIRYSTEYERNQAVATSTSVNGTTDTIDFSTSLFGDFFNNNLIRFASSDLAANIDSATTYYIKNVSSFSTQISTSPGGAAANLTNPGGPVIISMASLVANTSSGEFNPSNIIFNSFNTTLVLSGSMSLALPSTSTTHSDYVGIITLDTDSSYTSSQRFLPVTGRPNTQSCTALATASNELVTSSVYYNIPNTSPATHGNAFNVITKIDSGNIAWQRTSNRINEVSTINYPYELQGLLGKTSDGNVVNVINTQYNTLPFGNLTQRTEYYMSVNKLNEANGSTIWKRGVQPQGGNVYQYQGAFVGLAIDSGDDIYLSSKEINLDTSAFGTYGSFMLKLNNSGGTVWQKHYVGNSSNTMQIEDLHIDSSDQLYFVAKGPLDGTGPIISRPATQMIIGELDTSGNEMWSNKMTFSAGTSVFPIGIKKYDTSLYILAQNGDNNVGMLFKIPADGTIPGSGTYPISTSVMNYTITYASDSLNIVNSNMFLDTISTANLANLTATQFSSAIYSDDPITILQETRPLG